MYFKLNAYDIVSDIKASDFTSVVLCTFIHREWGKVFYLVGTKHCPTSRPYGYGPLPMEAG